MLIFVTCAQTVLELNLLKSDILLEQLLFLLTAV